jgi:ubiquinone/menaquinone biosynthesis C-methylase UbiE
MAFSGFDMLAPYYDRLARLVFGNSIKHAQQWLLRYLPPNATILIVGGGTGWILEDIAQASPSARIHYLDISQEMIRLSRERKTGDLHVTFQCGELWDLDSDSTFDVLLCPFFLDLFQGKKLRQVIQKLDYHLKPGGMVLYADFRLAGGSKRLWSAALIRTMYAFFKLIANISANKLEDPWPVFRHLGYTKVDQRRLQNSMI